MTGIESAAAVSTLIDSRLWAIPALPLCGVFLIAAFLGKPSVGQGICGWIATACSLIAFAITAVLFSGVGDHALLSKLGTWFSIPGESIENLRHAIRIAGSQVVPAFHVDLALRMDRLAGVMTLIVTGVGSLIHLYAIGYMEHDESRARFFLYLNLFLVAMLLLVLGDNLLVMFVGWEGVGLCSYLLIGFWYREMENAEAGQKAFVVNRIGDAGFLLGVFVLLLATGSVNFLELQSAVGSLSMSTIEIVALLLFIGAMGKSAQIPLYVWLPDAMAGPTPVSALIHAATMVTAGVYMVTRMSFLYAAAPDVLWFISCIGCLTAFFAATIALVQNDIKKVLAYSTVSQLGYMFMALGAGAFSNGIFHVVTHAFFKACLFMGAGSVIIGCHHEQDMRHFGGLRKYMPVTFVTYMAATFAIAGFPFTSGFYSKDAILWTVFSNETHAPVVDALFGARSWGHLFWFMGALTAFLTAFYMTRSLIMTFFGEYRGHEHPHESPWVVTVPLAILALLSLGFGIVDDGSLITFLSDWTRPDMRAAHEALSTRPMFEELEHLSMLIAVGGMGLAWVLYSAMPDFLRGLQSRNLLIYRALLNKWWIDELYAAAIVRPLRALADSGLFRIVDRALIDGTVNGAAEMVEAGHEMLRTTHTGRLGSYAVIMFSCSVLFTVFWLLL